MTVVPLRTLRVRLNFSCSWGYHKNVLSGIVLQCFMLIFIFIKFSSNGRWSANWFWVVQDKLWFCAENKSWFVPIRHEIRLSSFNFNDSSLKSKSILKTIFEYFLFSYFFCSKYSPKIEIFNTNFKDINAQNKCLISNLCF